jgi:hypothetical protein
LQFEHTETTLYRYAELLVPTSAGCGANRQVKNEERAIDGPTFKQWRKQLRYTGSDIRELIETSIRNVEKVLLEASAVVAVVLFAFLPPWLESRPGWR